MMFRDPFMRNKLLERSAIYIILVVVFVIAALVSPVFLKERNIVNVVRQAAILGVVVIGQTFVILTGGIDLSVASVMALMSILSANMMEGQNKLVLPVSLLCLAIAAFIGFANGLLVTKVRIPPFIATLGMLLMVQGFRFLYSGGMPKGSIPEHLRYMGKGMFIGFPVPIEQLKKKYGTHFEIVQENLHETDDLRVLDFDGRRAMELLPFEILGDPIYHEGLPAH